MNRLPTGLLAGECFLWNFFHYRRLKHLRFGIRFGTGISIGIRVLIRHSYHYYTTRFLPPLCFALRRFPVVKQLYHCLMSQKVIVEPPERRRRPFRQWRPFCGALLSQ